MNSLNFHKEVLAEHKSNLEHLDFHTKESVENLYLDNFFSNSFISATQSLLIF